MRILYLLPLLAMLTSCGFAPSDIVIGSAATYALFGDDIEQIESEELQDPKTYTDAVPPQAKQGAHRVANNFRDNVRHNSRKLKEWWFYNPELEKQQTGSVPSSYCYTTMQDIVCYSGPMPGWEHRLVGYQGTGAKAPPRVATKPLPRLAADGAKSADARLKDADPVFKDIPEEVKKEESEGAHSGGAAQEILPDPLISPQL